ncbi:hypothetical protein T484DRAFT_1747209 [Baffinella frigidus]|nr:hypothetical protein T484DRAFT_1747209 [Cryptophyta sp. CCMP2293]
MAHSNPTSGRPRRGSFEDATCSRFSAQYMPAAMPGRTNRRRSSVSWDTMIDVRIIPARACAQDDCEQPLKETKRSGTFEDATCSRLAAPPMPATSGRPRRHSSYHNVSWDTVVDVHTIPASARAQDGCELRGKSAERRVTFEDATCSLHPAQSQKIKRHTVIKRRL